LILKGGGEASSLHVVSEQGNFSAEKQFTIYSREKLGFNLSGFKIIQVIENLQREQLTSSPSTGGLSISATGWKVDATFRDDIEQDGQSTLRPQSRRTVRNSFTTPIRFAEKVCQHAVSDKHKFAHRLYICFFRRCSRLPIDLPQTQWRITLFGMLEAVSLSIQALLVNYLCGGASTYKK
jgi:hypothetical protein